MSKLLAARAAVKATGLNTLAQVTRVTGIEASALIKMHHEDPEKFAETISLVARFKDSVLRKLAAEGVNPSDRTKALDVLSKCVMGSKLMKAYDVLPRVVV